MIVFPVLLAILLGSIPTGVLVARRYKLDLKTEGSGSTGATNAFRVLGKKAGAITLLGDFFKGFLAVVLIPRMFPSSSPELQPLLGAAAVIGHCYSPFLKFKGGKGVATGVGAVFPLAPVAAVASVLIFVAVLKLTKFVSLASVSAATAFGAFILLGLPHKYSQTTIFATLVILVIILARHRSNFARLLKGEELKIETANR